MTIDTPILLTAFNRPDLLEKNLQTLVSYGIKHFFIATDGPREDNFSDYKKCQQVEKVIQKIASGGIEITRLKRDKNLGCKIAMSKAITWFFERVDYGIIIEDDCHASHSFLKFSQEMLERYQDDESVMHINGSNLLSGRFSGEGSYYFSAIPHVWGWATWRRAWIQYDMDINLDIFEDLEGYYDHKKDLERFYSEFEKTAKGQIDTWDYQWIYTVWKNKGLSITPSQNLVSNLGWGPDSTHTRTENNSLGNINRIELSFPLSHPKQKIINSKADRHIYSIHFKPPLTLNYLLYSKLSPFVKTNLPWLYRIYVSIVK